MRKRARGTSPRSRRVVVTIELETELPLATLRSVKWWRAGADKFRVLQAQANAIRAKR